MLEGCVLQLSRAWFGLDTCRAAGFTPLPPIWPVDELQGLLSEIDAEADLEAFTQVAASSVHRWAAHEASRLQMWTASS